MKRCYIYFFICLFFALSLLIGCGGGSVDFIPVVINNNNTNYVSLSGFVTEGTQSSLRTSSELRYSLGSNLSGIVVFIEDNKLLRGITDNDGKFIINGVPEGYHSLIAEKTEAGIITYRQRLNNINIKGTDNHFELPEPIKIIPSPYFLYLFITDKNNKPINNAKISLWGTDYSSDNNGLIKLSSFPTLSNIETTVIASGYKSSKMILSFGESLNSKIFVKLSQFSENNIAPIVAIKHEDNSSILKENNNLYISSNRQIILSALGNDPDGNTNKITWKWSADKGSFSGLTTAKTVTYTSPNNSGEVTITLVGKDEKGLEGKAELNLIIVGGSDIDTSTSTNTSTNTNTATSTSSDTSTDTETSTNTGTSTNSDTGTESQTQTNTDNEGIATFSVIFPHKTSEKLIINFDKPVITSEFTKSVNFLPVVNGEWSFSNNNKTASFIPEKGNWYPGSYNMLGILKDLKFEDGSLIKEAFFRYFTIDSEIPVPEGYHSYAFPMNFKANEAAACSIPLLKEGKNAYALILNYDKPMNNGKIIGASVGYNNDKDPTYQYRIQELELQNKKLPDIVLNGKSLANRASLKKHELYEQKKFFIFETNIRVIQTLLLGFNDKVLIYADVNISANTLEEIEDRVNLLLNEFSKNNGILQTNEDYFGKAPQCGPDGEDRLSIVLFNPTKGSLNCGYFAPRDLYNNDESDSILNISNSCKVVYLNYSMDNTNLKATLAHEFQHMIYFYNKGMAKFEENNYLLSQDDIWLNEGLSKLAEEINGFDINNNPNTASWILSSQLKIEKLSLTNWDGDTYGIAYLFMHYLTQPGRYKSSSKDVTRAIIASGRQDATKDIEKITNEPFKTTLAKWALSLYINDWNSSNPKAYGIHGINLEGKYSNIQLYGFPRHDIGYLDIKEPIILPKNGFVCVRTSSISDIGITAIAFISEQPTTVYFFDERE